MNTTARAHLPNAAHIDAVIASLKANPNEWAKAYAGVEAPRYAALAAARSVAWDVAWDAAVVVARSVAWDVALDAILALIAYNDCAHMLDSEPDDLRILSKFGVDAATLMIPAAVAFKLIRKRGKLSVDTTQ